MSPSEDRKAWTVMVYLAGDNSLDPEGVKDLKEMKKVGSTDRINVIAQFDRAAGHSARRYHLRKGGTIAGDAVADLGVVNTGDPKALKDFIHWGVKGYPAEHYLLVLWNHGQGWDDTDIYADERYRSLRRLASGRIRHAFFHTPVRAALEEAKGARPARAILLDDNAKDFLDNREMKKVLADAAKLLGRKIDVFGMDACLMSMAEVGYQVKDFTDFMVGSEQTEPGAGWPYDKILAALARDPAMSPRDLGCLVVEDYLASYGKDDGVTFAACDQARVGDLAAAVADLAAALKAFTKETTGIQVVQAARNRAQSYEVPDNIDLVDFCQLLLAAKPPAAVGAACQAVVNAVAGSYVVAQGYKGDDVRHSHGVAIYFPLRAVSPLYAGLDFSRKTGWDDFLASYLKAIRSR